MISTIYSPPSTRRLVELVSKRDRLARQRRELMRSMPRWALAPLRELGLSKQELAALELETDPEFRRQRLQVIDREIAMIDVEISAVERWTLDSKFKTETELASLVRLAAQQMRLISDGGRAADSSDLRIVELLDRAADDLETRSDGPAVELWANFN